MADEAMSRDRQIRADAVKTAVRIIAAQVANGVDVPAEYSRALVHIYAHYIHSGVWLNANEDTFEVECPYGEVCRFNRQAA